MYHMLLPSGQMGKNVTCKFQLGLKTRKAPPCSWEVGGCDDVGGVRGGGLEVWGQREREKEKEGERERERERQTENSGLEA